MVNSSLQPLIVILGPTAVGKTESSIQLAERFNGEIVSSDSRLFYIGMDIGTAKPTRAQRSRVPHHLIDIATPDQPWSLALFQNEAQRVIQDILSRGHLPFLVGGTGQYIQAVIQGWQVPTVKPDPNMRRILEDWAIEITPLGLHNRLAAIDPQAAQAIDPYNLRRTIRALEVIFSTGRIFSAQRQRFQSPYNLLQFGLTRPRDELYARVDQRIQGMVESDLVSEVQKLLSQGYSSDLPTMTAIGYREIIQYLQGEITLDEAIVLMKRRTRIFVRRQANWFKANDPDIHWFRMTEGTVNEITRVIQDWLVGSCN